MNCQLNTTILLMTLLTIGIVHAQQEYKFPSKTAKESYDIQKAVYSKALELQDDEMAYNALTNLIVLNPDDIESKVNLQRLYFKFREFRPCIILGEKIMEKEPGNAEVLDLIAKSREGLEEFSQAVIDYEKLFKLTGNPYYSYLAGYVQYRLLRYYECNIYLENLLNNKKLHTQYVDITYGDPAKVQHVPLRAAVLNLRGLVLFELKDYNNAVEMFREALKVFPEYELAKQNLDNTLSYQKR